MKPIALHTVTLLLAIVLIGSLVAPVWAGAATTNATATTKPASANTTLSRRSKITKLKKKNPATVGWLTVPGTTIDSVVVQNPNGNNNYYTTHDFYNNPSKNGTFGADYRATFGKGGRQGLARNTTLYAHNHDDNPNGILFAQLKKYKDPDFARKHPYLYFTTEDETMVWEIFAVYDSSIHLPYLYANMVWDNYRTVLEVVQRSSLYNYNIPIKKSDKLLTLSTCTFSVPGHPDMPLNKTNPYRFIIMARLVDRDEPLKQTAHFTINNAPLAPDDIPNYARFDLFTYNGVQYFNSNEYYARENHLQKISSSDLIYIGSIKRSHIPDRHQSWDSTMLPEGTPIYEDPNLPGVFIAQVGNELVPYTVQRPYRPIEPFETQPTQAVAVQTLATPAE